CAPFDTRGDGRVSSIDVSQAQAYQLGFNLTAGGTPQPAAGPTTPNPIAEPAGSLLSAGKLFDFKRGYNQSRVAAPREVRVVSTTANVGQNVTVMINVDAMGDESVYGFSLNYDATKLSNPVVTIGTAGGAVLSNATQSGRIGVSVSYGGGTIAAGNNQNLVRIQFTVAGNAMTGATPLTFGDSLTFREVASAPPNVTVLTMTFRDDGMLTINNPTTASVSVAGRVVTQTGRGIRNVIITMTNSNGNTRTATTSSFGYYRFADVAAGESYTFEVRAKRYRFTESAQVRNITGDIDDVIFVADNF
ncbi:MAG: carboxypeptidase regulatory-like domain-containing protein, partial [Pyrinomonadaceae bacterium]